MNAMIRDLADGELSQVSGGGCTCGAGADCTTQSSLSTGDGSSVVLQYNCSGALVYYSFLRD